MKGLGFIIKKIGRDTAYTGIFILAYALLFRTMDSQVMAMVVMMMTYMVPVMVFMNVGSSYMNMILTAGSTRREFFTLSCTLKVLVAIFAFALFVIVTRFVDMPVAFSVQTVAMHLIVNIILAGIGELIGFGVVKMGRKFVWVYTIMFALLGSVFGGLTAISGQNAMGAATQWVGQLANSWAGLAVAVALIVALLSASYGLIRKVVAR